MAGRSAGRWDRRLADFCPYTTRENSMRIRLSVASTMALVLITMSPAQSMAQDALPEGPGKASILGSCSQCHDLETAIGKKRTPQEWVEVMDRMGQFGMSLSDSTRAEILDYLNAHLNSAPPVPAPATPGGGAAASRRP